MAILNITFHKTSNIKKGTLYCCDLGNSEIHISHYMLNPIKNNIIYGEFDKKIMTTTADNFLSNLKQKKENIILVEYENTPLNSMQKVIAKMILDKLLTV